MPISKGRATRDRILDIAEAAVLLLAVLELGPVRAPHQALDDDSAPRRGAQELTDRRAPGAHEFVRVAAPIGDRAKEGFRSAAPATGVIDVIAQRFERSTRALLSFADLQPYGLERKVHIADKRKHGANQRKLTKTEDRHDQRTDL